MNLSRRLGWFLLLALGPSFPSQAVTVNDGSTTNNLTQIFNSSPWSEGDPVGAVVSLQVGNCSTNCALTAVQAGEVNLFALRSAWYAREVAPTSGVYSVSAAFQPADVSSQNRGGVMGWLSLSASNGIILQVVPEGGFDPKSFRVSVVDFTADNANDNESLAHLFDTNGSPATTNFASAWSELGANYSATNFATFQLAFSTPTPGDLAALSNATAHVTAAVFQGTETNGAPIQVSRMIELLTDLPIPPRGSHRFGYYAVWASIFGQGDIGYLDDLTGEGGVASTANTPPSVSLSSPSDGATFTEPATVPIVANATDTDGTIRQVDFFAGSTLLGTMTNSPFNFTWTNVVAGSYSLTARATDDGGGTSTSSPVDITVTPATGGGPTLRIALAGNSIEISWPTAGYMLQMATNLSAPTWIDVPNSQLTNRVTLTLSGGATFFRLFQQSAPAGPRLSILLSGNSVTVSWPASVTSYRLQTKSDLNPATWTDVATSNNQVTEAITGSARFYRLSQ
jgi:hypothetical protein